MAVSKRTLITVSFYIIYLSFFTFAMLGHTPVVGEWLKISTYGGLGMLTALILFRIRDYSWHEVFVLFILLIYGLGIAYNTGDFVLFKLGMMIFAAKGIDFRKCIKFDLLARIILTAIVLLFFYLGVLPDVTSYYEGRLRHSYGFLNPNHVGIDAFILIAEILYLSNLKIGFKNLFISFFILLVTDFMSGSRTAEIMNFIIIILAMIYSRWKWVYNGVFAKIILRYSTWMFSGLTFALAWLYSLGISAIIALDIVFSGRLSNIICYYDSLGISLFGGELLEVGRTNDSFYGFVLIGLGLVTFFLAMFAYQHLEKKLCIINQPLAIVVFSFFLYGLSERLWMNVDYNIFMLAFAEVLYSKFSVSDQV